MSDSEAETVAFGQSDYEDYHSEAETVTFSQSDFEDYFPNWDAVPPTVRQRGCN